jgi:WD40 repeat protein
MGLDSGHADLSSDEKRIAISNLHGGVDVYELSSTILLTSLKPDADQNVASPVLFIHGGRSILTASSTGRVRLWNAQTGQPLHSLRTNGG